MSAKKTPSYRRERRSVMQSPKRNKRNVVQSLTTEKVTYRLETVFCGKVRCRSCPHGPYWYAYFRGRGGGQVSKYIGKSFRLLPWDRGTPRPAGDMRARIDPAELQPDFLS